MEGDLCNGRRISEYIEHLLNRILLLNNTKLIHHFHAGYFVLYWFVRKIGQSCRSGLYFDFILIKFIAKLLNIND